MLIGCPGNVVTFMNIACKLKYFRRRNSCLPTKCCSRRTKLRFDPTKCFASGAVCHANGRNNGGRGLLLYNCIT